jgi:hypothetical protein
LRVRAVIRAFTSETPDDKEKLREIREEFPKREKRYKQLSEKLKAALKRLN